MAAQHSVLMTQDEQLDLLGGASAREHYHQADQPTHQRVRKREHQPVMLSTRATARQQNRRSRRLTEYSSGTASGERLYDPRPEASRAVTAGEPRRQAGGQTAKARSQHRQPNHRCQPPAAPRWARPAPPSTTLSTTTGHPSDQRPPQTAGTGPRPSHRSTNPPLSLSACDTESRNASELADWRPTMSDA
jgi:hypothetical protein